jgi:hypothetical protein
MSENDFNIEDDGRYYTELAAAFVRGKIGREGDSSGTPPTLVANCASIALVCAPRTMRESA